jgi:phosphoserine phosphatase RsbU/P
MPSIVILKAGESTAHELRRDETIIGRHPECHIQLDSNVVSRKHARIVRDGARFFVEDLGSGNGTTLNGQRIETRTALSHDDRIRLGPVLMRFIDPAATSGGREPSPDESGFRLRLSEAAEDEARITSTVSAGSTRFGLLDTQPAIKLKGVLEISRSLAGTVDIEAILPKILETLLRIFPAADRACILLKDAASGEMIPQALRHRGDTSDDTVRLSRTIINRVLTEKAGILSADAATDARFQASESIANFTIRSMMCVPLLGLDGEPIGIINVDTLNAQRQFQNDDLDVLLVVAGQAALSYENARLVASHLEKQKQDNEIRIAARVQRALLPEKLPVAPGYEFFAAYEAALSVGGDYYDCLPMPGDKICVAFGDVAGKGIPASLVMSRLSSVVQNTMELETDVARAAARINNHMCSHAVEGRFVTFTLAVIDLKSHAMTLILAGHMSPMIFRNNGEIEEVPEDIVGLPLGVLENLEFESYGCTLAPGDTVVIYTDGVSEALDPASELYTIERLRQKVRQGPHNPAALGHEILADVKRHAAGRPQSDDITLMVFGRTSEPSLTSAQGS